MAVEYPTDERLALRPGVEAVARRVDADEALAAAHEAEECRALLTRERQVGRVVENDRIEARECGGGEARQILAQLRLVGARDLAQQLQRLVRVGNGGVHVALGAVED